jgi:hypothetical protein
MAQQAVREGQNSRPSLSGEEQVDRSASGWTGHKAEAIEGAKNFQSPREDCWTLTVEVRQIVAK